jgi:hypothetical protein
MTNLKKKGTYGCDTELSESGLEIHIEYDYYPGEDDQIYDSNGDPGTPGYPPTVEITAIWAELPDPLYLDQEVNILDVVDSDQLESFSEKLIEKHNE